MKSVELDFTNDVSVKSFIWCDYLALTNFYPKARLEFIHVCRSDSNCDEWLGDLRNHPYKEYYMDWKVQRVWFVEDGFFRSELTFPKGKYYDIFFESAIVVFVSPDGKADGKTTLVCQRG